MEHLSLLLINQFQFQRFTVVVIERSRLTIFCRINPLLSNMFLIISILKLYFK